MPKLMSPLGDPRSFLKDMRGFVNDWRAWQPMKGDTVGYVLLMIGEHGTTDGGSYGDESMAVVEGGR